MLDNGEDHFDLHSQKRKNATEDIVRLTVVSQALLSDETSDEGCDKIISLRKQAAVVPLPQSAPERQIYARVSEDAEQRSTQATSSPVHSGMILGLHVHINALELMSQPHEDKKKS